MKTNIKNPGLPTFLGLLFLNVCYLFLLPACEKQKNFSYEYDNPGGKMSISAWQFVQQTDSLALLSEAITAAGLQDYYSNAEVHTFIMPTNAAFRTYMSVNKYTSIAAIPVPILRNTLLYHIVKAKVLFSDPALSQNNNPIAYETANGQSMYLSHNANYQGLINEQTNKSWTISVSNLEPVNGVIHIVPELVYFSAKTAGTNIPDPAIVSDTIYATQDTYINGGSLKASNFGSDPLIKLKNVDGSGDYDRKIYLMFDLNQLTKTGTLRNASIEVGVNFTHGLGLKMDLYNVADTSWSEKSMNWNNAPAPDQTPVASLVTGKVATFQWNCTGFIGPRLQQPRKISVMLDGEAKGNETNDLISKENPLSKPPRLVVTFSSGNSMLEMGINNGMTVSKGGIAVLKTAMLEMKGAAPADIIYTLESAPANGWLIMGSSILTTGSKFTQLDLDMSNIVYVHSGSGGAADQLSLSVADPDGGLIEPFDFNISIQ
ncbi:DUF7594 domain-containing protein [Niabella beijingensis]|uniref:CBM96 family carbohydrate-binding protein n=1 Tax=Niabella beijingensis TaxID=2872700 RepID=UPI001CBC2317|nr:DNRLRE domain-containing protein [Niabella beijingensis]MBZ4192141.1 DNRLRE domain-containing protein [Niabella beijingensis]